MIPPASEVYCHDCRGYHTLQACIKNEIKEQSLAYLCPRAGNMGFALLILPLTEGTE